MTNDLNADQRTRFKPVAICTAVAAAVALAGASAFALTNPDAPDKSTAQPDLKVEHAPVDRGRTPAGSFAPIVQKVAPSVVEVFVTSKGGRQELSSDQQELLRHFFGRGGNSGQFNQEGPSAPQHGLGSGVIVSPDGYILTNNHVIKDASEILVALSDGRQFPAKVIGTDPKTDVALVKIKADKLPALTFADSSEIAVGDVVLAVGNPFGIGQTVTQGIVSAKDRVTSGEMDEDFIQTDAAINPGNSGGALVDTEGRLVGLNSAILSRSGGNQGIGFAIPANLCQWVMTNLVKNGRVERGFMGVGIQNLTPPLAQEFKLDRINGALVSDVNPDSPADKGGLKSGDVIRGYNGQPIKDASQLKLQVAQTTPGTKVPVEVVRNGETKTLDVTLRNLPNEPKLARNNTEDKSGSPKEALAGVNVADLDRNARAEMNVPEQVQGAVIIEVSQNFPAYEAGLRPGDVITEINHQPIKNAQDAVTNTENPVSNETLVKVWSHGRSRYLTVDEKTEG